MVRLNGAVGQIFTDWIWKAFPDKAQRVLVDVESVHEGKLNDSRWGKRMTGDGNLADAIHQLFDLMQEKYFSNKKKFEYNLKAFRRPGQMQLQFRIQSAVQFKRMLSFFYNNAQGEGNIPGSQLRGSQNKLDFHKLVERSGQRIIFSIYHVILDGHLPHISRVYEYPDEKKYIADLDFSKIFEPFFRPG